MRYDLQYLGIHQWAEGFHNVIGQAKGIILVVVVNAQCTQQSAATQRPCYSCSQYDIPIVEEWVRVVAVALSFEIKIKKVFPVIGSGSPFAIIGVTTQHF